MKKGLLIFLILVSGWAINAFAEESAGSLQMKAPKNVAPQDLRLRTNILPWAIAVPNIGAEYCFSSKWSAVLDVWYCPWKISDKFSLKTAALLPEARWWLRSCSKGSYFNVHLSVAWFNLRANSYRYQTSGRPLLGAGIGYGYRLPLNSKWALEFEIGAGMFSARYDRFYNIPNGSLKDTRVSTYWGIDRAAVSVTYNI